MGCRRAQLKYKLLSLEKSRTKLLIHLQQQQEQNMTSLSTSHEWRPTSSLADQQLIVNIVDDTLDTATALLKVTDHCYEYDQLQQNISTQIDLAWVLLLLNFPSCSDPELLTSDTMTTSTLRPTCYDLMVAFFIGFVVVGVWFVEIWSAMSINWLQQLITIDVKNVFLF